MARSLLHRMALTRRSDTEQKATMSNAARHRQTTASRVLEIQTLLIGMALMTR